MAPKQKVPGDGGGEDAPRVTLSRTPHFGESPVKRSTLRQMGEGGLLDPSKPRATKLEETMSKPNENEVVVFQDMFYARLWFPLDPVVVGILKHLKISLHQLTPNAFVRYMWVYKTTKVTLSPEGFSYVHRVHKQPRIIVGASRNSGEEVKTEGNLIWMPELRVQGRRSGPVTTYRNKWSDDCWTEWFYIRWMVRPLGLSAGPLSTLQDPLLRMQIIIPKGSSMCRCFRRLRRHTLSEMWRRNSACAVFIQFKEAGR